jgi:hypothetical protein
MTLNKEKYRIEFMIKNIFGRDIDFSNVDSIVLKCIDKAYMDMLSGGRFYVNHLEGFNKKNIITNVKQILEKFNYKYSIEMLNETICLFGNKEKIGIKGNNNNYATRLGLSQKIINMTYKYLYCINEFIKELNIDYSLCDCPIDSIVLKRLNINSCWTKLEMKEYSKIQEEITLLLKIDHKEDYEVLGNLLLDFIVW